MKTRQLVYTWLVSLWALGATFSCDPAVNTHQAEVGEAVRSLQPLSSGKTFLIDTSQSRISWIGAKVTGRHNGIIPLQQGYLLLRNNQVTGGNVLLDMQALHAADNRLDEAGNQKLSKHLKSNDFFDVERFPTATFDVVSVRPYQEAAQQKAGSNTPRQTTSVIENLTHSITGNLTIKGITRSITFPARVALEDGELKAQANFNIDRTHWGLTYGADESLGNKTIHPIVNIGVEVVAIPQNTTL